MNPDLRKLQSETALKAAGVAVNDALPPLAGDDQVTLRTPEQVMQRLVALWAVAGKAMVGKESGYAAYIVRHKLQHWLSPAERRFILDKRPSTRDNVNFSWQLEALFFVAWSAGLLDADAIPETESSIEPIMGLFPQAGELPERLMAAITMRAKSGILDRADLLYRLDWAVRETGPPAIEAEVVHEWRRAANWLLGLDPDDDWNRAGGD